VPCARHRSVLSATIPLGSIRNAIASCFFYSIWKVSVDMPVAHGRTVFEGLLMCNLNT